MQRRAKKGDASKKILLAVSSTAAGGLLLHGSPRGASPAVKSFAEWYKNQDRQGKYRIRKTFEDLRRERLIDMHEDTDGNTTIILTEHGRKKVLTYRMNAMKIKSMKRWDKKWRMVIFDIPEQQKKARNALRNKLVELGFKQLQKSVWIHPYECKDEIDFAVEFFDVKPYVRIAEIHTFDGEEAVKKEFNLF